MSNTQKEIEEFIENINNTLRPQDSTKVLEIIKGDMGARDFYKLCQSFLDIALNTEITTAKNPNILKEGEIEKVYMHYREEDVAVAYEKFRGFALTHTMLDFDELMMMIKTRYQESLSPNEKRPTRFTFSSVSDEGEVNYNGDVYRGTEYDLTKLRAWNAVETAIIGSLTR